jgi:hypothetical protein
MAINLILERGVCRDNSFVIVYICLDVKVNWICEISSNNTLSLQNTFRFLATDPAARVRFPALPGRKVVGLERGALSLVSTTVELLDRKVAAPVYKTENTAVGIRHADHVTHSNP